MPRCRGSCLVVRVFFLLLGLSSSFFLLTAALTTANHSNVVKPIFRAGGWLFLSSSFCYFRLLCVCVRESEPQREIMRVCVFSARPCVLREEHARARSAAEGGPAGFFYFCGLLLSPSDQQSTCTGACTCEREEDEADEDEEDARLLVAAPGPLRTIFDPVAPLDTSDHHRATPAPPPASEALLSRTMVSISACHLFRRSKHR